MSGAIDYRFDHVHFYCSDLAASERWFVEGMGAELVRRVEAQGSSMTLLRLGGATMLLRPAYEGEDLGPAGPPRFGTDHIGLEVDDLDATAAELKRRGVEFIMEPMEFRPGVRISYVIGPDKVQIEVLERKG
ncbi:MAG: VOC family protein [Chloroflexota bacterium]